MPCSALRSKVARNSPWTAANRPSRWCPLLVRRESSRNFRRVVDQDRDIGGIVSHGEIRQAVSIEVAHQNTLRPAHAREVLRCLERPIAGSQKQRDTSSYGRVPTATGHGEVRQPVAIEVAHRQELPAYQPAGHYGRILIPLEA